MLEIIGRESFDGLKFAENKTSLKDSRKIIKSYNLGDTEVVINLNQQDAELLTEEQQIETDGLTLKKRFGGIEKIPKDEVINSGFTRILVKDKYILFKKLKRGDGIIVVK